MAYGIFVLKIFLVCGGTYVYLNTVRKDGACVATGSNNIFIRAELRCVLAKPSRRPFMKYIDWIAQAFPAENLGTE